MPPSFPSRAGRLRSSMAMIGPLLLAVSGAGVAAGASPPPAASTIPVLPGEPWIAYTRNALYLIRPDGTGEHMILPQFADPQNGSDWLHGVYNPEWSPDGSRLAFPNGALPGWPIWVADADGSDPEELVPCGEGCQFLDAPAFSPDGESLAYVRFTGEWPPSTFTRGGAVEILDLRTGETRSVLESTTPDFFEYPRWSPDGRSLVLTVLSQDEEETRYVDSAIAVVDLDGPGAATVRAITPRGLGAAYPDWSPTGDRIVFHAPDAWWFPDRAEGRNLYTIGPDGLELTQLTAFGEGYPAARQPTWTPDGSEVIFVEDQSPNDARIAFVSFDGSTTRVIEGIWGTHPRLRPVP